MAFQGSFSWCSVLYSHLFQGAPILSRKIRRNVIYVITSSYIYMQFISDLSPTLGKRSPVSFSMFGKDRLVIANLRVGKFQN